jgi:antitoxin ParD1/3/4
MNISMTPELEKLVSSKVESGLYQSASEVIREALRLLVEQDETRRRRLDRLDQDIELGLGQAARGEFCDPGQLEKNLNEIIAGAEGKRG